MKLLLDTEVLLWWLADDAKLGAQVRDQLMAGGVEVFISAASMWEMSMLRAKGDVRFDTDELMDELDRNTFQQLPITFAHANAVGALPQHHKDPVDRMLVAQARVEGLDLVTYDKALKPYGVPVLRRK